VEECSFRVIAGGVEGEAGGAGPERCGAQGVGDEGSGLQVSESGTGEELGGLGGVRLSLWVTRHRGAGAGGGVGCFINVQVGSGFGAGDRRFWAGGGEEGVGQLWALESPLNGSTYKKQRAQRIIAHRDRFLLEESKR